MTHPKQTSANEIITTVQSMGPFCPSCSKQRKLRSIDEVEHFIDVWGAAYAFDNETIYASYEGCCGGNSCMEVFTFQQVRKAFWENLFHRDSSK